MRIISYLMMLLSSASAGMCIIGNKKRELRKLKEFVSMLELIKCEIEFTSDELSCVFKRIHISESSFVSDFAEIIQNVFTENNNQTFQNVWCDAVKSQLTFLDRNVQSTVLQLGNVLGRYDVKNQLSQIQICIEELKRYIYSKELILQNNSKLYVFLPAAGVLMIIIAIS